MHVLIIPSWYPKNPDDINGSFFREQALALQRCGCKIGVIAPQLISLRSWESIFTQPKGIFYELDEGIPTLRRPGMAWFPRIPYGNATLSVSYGLKLFDEYIKNHGKPDILHAHSLLYGGEVARKINQRYNIPFVVTEHSSAFARNMLKRWQICYAERAVVKASARIAVSESFCKLLSDIFQGANTAWTYLPNIVPPRFERVPFKYKCFDEKSFSFCNVSLLNPNKCIDTLLRAFALAFRSQENIALSIGGDGPEKKNLQKLARDLGIQNQVKFMGMLSREEVLCLMQNSNAYVLSSHFETFGVVLVESLALGRPVIATRCGGPESIVRPEDGYLVPPDNADALAEVMERMYQNYNIFDQQRIVKDCLARFGENAVCEKLKIIYKQALLTKNE